MALMQNITNIILTFVARIIFVHILDASYLGINGLFVNILNVLSMADLGMSTALMYSLYAPIADADEEKIASLINFFKKIYLGIAILVSVVGVALIPFLPYIVNLDHEIPHLVWYYLLALANVVISYLFIYRTVLLEADQQGWILNKYLIYFRFITFGVQIIVLILFKNYFLYLLVAVVTSFICNLVQNKKTLINYPYLKKKAKPLSIEDRHGIVSNVKSLFIYKIAGVINNDVDSVLISILVGTIFVGYYSNYQIIMTGVVVLVTSVFQAIKSSIGNYIACNAGTRDDELNVYNTMEFFNYWLVGFCSICCLCLIDDCISIAFGREYLLGVPVVIVIILNFYSGNVCQTLWMFRETTGMFNQTKYITAMYAIINLCLSIVLGYMWGVFGIILATCIARYIYPFWKEPNIIFSSYFKTVSRTYFIKRIVWGIKTILVALGTYMACSMVKNSFVWIAMLEKMIICLIVPNILYLALNVRNKEFRKIIQIIKNRRGERNYE